MSLHFVFGHNPWAGIGGLRGMHNFVQPVSTVTGRPIHPGDKKRKVHLIARKGISCDTKNYHLVTSHPSEVTCRICKFHIQKSIAAQQHRRRQVR